LIQKLHALNPLAYPADIPLEVRPVVMKDFFENGLLLHQPSKPNPAPAHEKHALWAAVLAVQTSAQAGVPVPQKHGEKVAVHVQDRGDFCKD
jgi:hypothetical protein